MDQPRWATVPFSRVWCLHQTHEGSHSCSMLPGKSSLPQSVVKKFIVKIHSNKLSLLAVWVSGFLTECAVSLLPFILHCSHSHAQVGMFLSPVSKLGPSRTRRRQQGAPRPLPQSEDWSFVGRGRSSAFTQGLFHLPPPSGTGGTWAKGLPWRGQ